MPLQHCYNGVMVKIFSLVSGLKISTLIIATAGLVVVGGGGTALAAQNTKPGDILYGIKLASENVRVALAFTDGMKKSTMLSIANERLEEVQQLLDEKSVDASGIQTALDNLEKEKSALLKLASSQDDAKSVTEIGDKAESLKTEIDKLFETKQNTLETQRETLKKQLETATKTGDITKVTDLQTQISAIEPQLKTLETTRETAKDQLEITEEEQETQAEAEKKAQEAQAEADKKAQEAQAEADKKAAEQQQEDQKDD